MSDRLAVAARAGLLLVALAAIALGLTRLHQTRSCTSASNDAFAVGLGAPATHIGSIVDEIAAQCRGGSALASAAVVLVRVGQLRQARRVAGEAVRREPDSYLSWFALALTEQRAAPVSAVVDLARSHALDPRYAASAPSVTLADAGAPLSARNPARSISGGQ